MTQSDARKTVDLREIRTDGWFEELGAEIPEFEQLCQIIGRRFVAFSFVSGVRIASVAYDAQDPHGSLVDFTVGDDADVQQLPLSELRERLGDALLAAEEDLDSLPDDPTTEEIQQHIGRRYLLLSPVFGLGLEALEVGGGNEPMLRLRLGGGAESISVQGLRDVIHNAIRSEVARARPSQAFSIDFKKVPMAESANQRGDWEETVALLGSWPGPLSMFLRTPQGQALGASERSKLVRALSALGEAYLRKRQGDWAEDVLRLGIQFGQELPASAQLFMLLGLHRTDSERFGEGIGLLRRALALGASPERCLPSLARCYEERGRHVAAIACLDEARAAGVPSGELDALRTRVARGAAAAAARAARRALDAALSRPELR
jgi:tetratricopeptide (TPR) repeat protein